MPPGTTAKSEVQRSRGEVKYKPKPNTILESIKVVINIRAGRAKFLISFTFLLVSLDPIKAPASIWVKTLMAMGISGMPKAILIKATDKIEPIMAPAGIFIFKAAIPPVKAVKRVIIKCIMVPVQKRFYL